MCGGKHKLFCSKFLAESKVKKIFKIGQHLAKLCKNNIVGLFLTHSVVLSILDVVFSGM